MQTSFAARRAGSPDRIRVRWDGCPHEVCCRTGRVEAWCTWSSWWWLPSQPSCACGSNSGAKQPSWTRSRGSHLHSRLWPHPRGRLDAKGTGPPQVDGSECRGRGNGRCSDGSSQIDPTRERAPMRATESKRGRRAAGSRRGRRNAGRSRRAGGTKRAGSSRRAGGQHGTARLDRPKGVLPHRPRGGSRWRQRAQSTILGTRATRVRPVLKMFGE
jgi:hypothetical protein